jgi:hypothetical protein
LIFTTKSVVVGCMNETRTYREAAIARYGNRGAPGGKAGPGCVMNPAPAAVLSPPAAADLLPASAAYRAADAGSFFSRRCGGRARTA